MQLQNESQASIIDEVPSKRSVQVTAEKQGKVADVVSLEEEIDEDYELEQDLM